MQNNITYKRSAVIYLFIFPISLEYLFIMVTSLDIMWNLPVDWIHA